MLCDLAERLRRIRLICSGALPLGFASPRSFGAKMKGWAV